MSYSKKPNFLESVEAVNVKARLLQMQTDRAFNTHSTYSADETKYPNHQMSFVDKHMAYLASHPAVDPEHYLANLRLISKIR
jgi:hypothetical protein